MNGPLIVAIAVVIVCLIVVAKTAIVVPQQSAYVVERLGRYNNTLHAGFHILVPFVDVIRYRHSLKETALDIPAQICITRDNVQVQVDGVLYLKILDPERASYGISDYHFAISQLAQTTLRSEVGKIDLDRTFEERTNINTQVVNELDKATESWGVKVLRYEIKNITPPADVLAAMEKQMRAEREKRAVILTSEGQRDAAINNADGEKQQVIKASEARKQQQINEAEGQASAILAVASATAEGIRRVAETIRLDGGYEAVQLRVAEQYVHQFGQLAQKSTTLVVPATVSDVAGMIAMAMQVLNKKPAGSPPQPPPIHRWHASPPRAGAAARLARRIAAGTARGGTAAARESAAARPAQQPTADSRPSVHFLPFVDRRPAIPSRPAPATRPPSVDFTPLHVGFPTHGLVMSRTHDRHGRYADFTARHAASRFGQGGNSRRNMNVALCHAPT